VVTSTEAVEPKAIREDKDTENMATNLTSLLSGMSALGSREVAYMLD
jgi:hypothetical protein